MRLIGFTVALALVFGAALLAGDVIGPDRDGAHADAHGSGMGHGAMHGVQGLAVAQDGLALRLDTRTAQPGTPTTLRFAITREDGSVVRDFDVEHTKRMHLIVVRRDLTGFQHLHPVMAADGTWTVPVTLPDAGTYRVFADFSADGTSTTLGDDLTVDGDVRSQPLPAAEDTVTIDGLTVTRDGLNFTVTRNGQPVALEDYLGAKGHLVALREGDLAFLHVHPDDDRLGFDADFPAGGRYRLFLQFQTDDTVHTAAFTR